MSLQDGSFNSAGDVLVRGALSHSPTPHTPPPNPTYTHISQKCQATGQPAAGLMGATAAADAAADFAADVDVCR
uniref:HDC16086 n=1 Tax=Drosophila melanogaster TaxID=7227 RepID=Q6IJ29_DROME|nr:TPA_inf: HDC16086 [Drosophila melanogaster]